MGRVYDALARQGKELGMDGLVQGLGRTALEVGPTASLDEQRVARQNDRFVVRDVRKAPGCVSGRCAGRYAPAAERDPVPGVDRDVALRARGFGDHGLQIGHLLLEEPGPRHVIGVRVGVDAVHQIQAQFLHLLQISLDLDVHRIYEDRVLRFRIPQKVGVRRRFVVKELFEPDFIALPDDCSANAHDNAFVVTVICR